LATREKEESFGGCSFDHISPKAISDSAKSLNIIFSFPEALKLNLAIDECVRTLNKYNRSTREGRDAALCLTVYFKGERVTVTESSVK
jgi:hypothetical protein